MIIYKLKDLRYDVISGLTVSAILVPQAVAYAVLAGMPPIYGLYAGLTALLVYPIFGTSKVLSVGPVALIGIILMSSLSSMEEPFSDAYVKLVLFVGLLSGLIQIGLGFLRLGSLSKFLSQPVLKGFLAGAAVIIIASQMKSLFGVKIGQCDGTLEVCKKTFLALPDFNPYAVAIGVGSIVVIKLLQWLSRSIPAHLVVVVAGILISAGIGLSDSGLQVVGDLPSGLPYFSADFMMYERILQLLPVAMVVSLICFVSAYSIGRNFEDYQSNHILPNRELISLGLTKLVGSFFLSMPTTGSFSRSAVNHESGAATKGANYVTAATMALVLLFLGQYFYYLPYSVLAAIILTSVINFIDIGYIRKLYTFDKVEFILLAATFAITVVWGVTAGITIGCTLSLLYVINSLSVPHYAILGQLKGTSSYRNIERYPDAILEDTALVIRYDQNLFFGNADHFYRSMKDEIQKRPHLEKVILHIGPIHSIDSTSIEFIKKLFVDCRDQNIKLIFTNMSGQIRDLFYRTKLMDEMGDGAFYLSVADAINERDPQDRAMYATQSNLKK